MSVLLDIQREEACSYYRQALTLGVPSGTAVATIMGRYGVSHTTVYRWLKLGGTREPVARVDTLEANLPARVDRDPCTYCGIRGDIGCKHKRPFQ